MSKTAARVLGLATLLALGACNPYPYPYPQYVTPAPPPLMPYMGPVAWTAPAKPAVKRRYVRKHYHRAPRCRCTEPVPVSQTTPPAAAPPAATGR